MLSSLIQILSCCLDCFKLCFMFKSLELVVRVLLFGRRENGVFLLGLLMLSDVSDFFEVFSCFLAVFIFQVDFCFRLFSVVPMLF